MGLYHKYEREGPQPIRDQASWRRQSSRRKVETRNVCPEWSGRGDVTEAEIADVNGRAAGKVLLQALEVEPAQEAGIFARVACAGVVDPELGDYAVQILGMWKDRKEFVVHLCAPQEPVRCGETGASLHCEKWTVLPGEAGRGVDAESAEASRRTGRGLRPEIAEAGPALFGPTGGEGLEAQVAALAANWA